MKRIFCQFGVAAMVLTLGFCPAALASQEPIFSQSAPHSPPVRVKITADFKTLTKRAARSVDPFAGQLTVMEPGHFDLPIKVSARGRSRRIKSNCRFPPLRVKFDKKPQYPSPFAGQKSLKLVTHCQSAASYQKFVALEYVSYRFLNQMTSQSLRPRLALIDYVQEGSNTVIATRQAFFIEDTDDAAKRNGLKEIDVADINIADLNPEAAARTALFQYMLSNLDYSMNAPAQGADCCHNTKLLGTYKQSRANLIPVPYDFDSTGFVSAPYARPPAGMGSRNLRTRLYRGFCAHNPQLRRQARQFIAKKPSFFKEIDALRSLDPKSKAKAKQFLQSFFNTLENPQSFESKIIGNCR